MRKRSTVIAATVAVVVFAVPAAWAFYALTSNTANRSFTAASLGTPNVAVSGLSFTVSAPSVGPQPTGYRVDRVSPSPATDVCPTLATGPGVCSDGTAVAGQNNVYAVYGLLGNWVSATSASVTIPVPAATPALSITFPAAGGTYNATSWTAGCGTPAADICGTAANTGAVSVSVRNGAGSYWNGTTFTGTTETLHAATGTTSWSLAMAGPFSTGQTYTVRAVSGSVSTSATFTWDTAAPSATNVVSANSGANTAGRVEAADTLTLTFSESVDPASIATGWNGSARNVVVRATDSGNNDTLTIFDSTNTTQVPIGTVSLGESFFTGSVTYGATGTASTMTLSGGTLTITLGTVSDASKLNTLGGSNQKSKLTWTPTATVKDLAGNACSTTAFVAGNATQF